MTLSLKGTATALVTPFNQDGSVDLGAFEALVHWQIENGIDVLVPCGTTGESATVSNDERKSLIETAVKASNGRAPVVAGTGGNDTEKAAALQIIAREAGADATLVVTPFYNKPNQSGLRAHYEAVAAAADIPVVLYNVPGRTGCDMSPATINQLATIPGVIGVKEATADLDRIVPIMRGTPEGFTLLSGDDFTALPFVLLGGDGVISVTSNFAPKMMSKMIAGGASGDLAKARELHHALHPLFHAMFLESNPVPVKTAMAWREMMTAQFRAPLGPMGEVAKDAFIKILASHPWA